MKQARDIRRERGVYVLIAVVLVWIGVTATFGLGRAVPVVRDATEGTASRPPFIPAPDPVYRGEAGISPDATTENLGQPSPAIRTIQVFPEHIYLTAGGRISRDIACPRPVRSLEEIVAAVNDPDWISRSGGTVTVNAGLLLEPGTDVTIAAPVERVVLAVRDGVYLGVTGAHLAIDGVRVQASDDHIPRDGTVGNSDRPFVFAYEDARLDIANSQFAYLGRDWNGSYGVSWLRRATGSAVNSIFESGFIGAFTHNSHDIVFRGNTFRDNVLYGLDPHTSTTGLVVESNIAERNGHHGIILSDQVSGALLRNNISRNNGINGIMMDLNSDNNIIENNAVTGNRGDGIALSGSSANRVTGNTVAGNRVGITVYGGSSVPHTVERNIVRANAVAGEGVTLLPRNTLIRNGAVWRPAVIVLVWVLVLVFGMFSVLHTRRTRRRTMQQQYITMRLAMRQGGRMPKGTRLP